MNCFPCRLGQCGVTFHKFLFLKFQNNIPVFSPALTDGSIGDMIYFHSYKNPGLILDIVEGKRLVTRMTNR